MLPVTGVQEMWHFVCEAKSSWHPAVTHNPSHVHMEGVLKQIPVWTNGALPSADQDY